MATPLAHRTLERLIELSLATGVRGLKEELKKLESLDPKEPNFKTKMEMRLKIIRLLAELSGDLKKEARAREKVKKGVEKEAEIEAAEEAPKELTPEEIEERKIKLSESQKKLEKTK